MQDKVLIKIYGLLTGVSENIFTLLEPLFFEAIGTEENLKNNFMYNPNKKELNFSFEGVYFPFDDFLKIIIGETPTKKQSYLLPTIFQTVEGRLDYIDMDNWNLTRLTFKDKTILYASTSLNNILSHSGH